MQNRFHNEPGQGCTHVPKNTITKALFNVDFGQIKQESTNAGLFIEDSDRRMIPSLKPTSGAFTNSMVLSILMTGLETKASLVRSHGRSSKMSPGNLPWQHALAGRYLLVPGIEKPSYASKTALKVDRLFLESLFRVCWCLSVLPFSKLNKIFVWIL